MALGDAKGPRALPFPISLAKPRPAADRRTVSCLCPDPHQSTVSKVPSSMRAASTFPGIKCTLSCRSEPEDAWVHPDGPAPVSSFVSSCASKGTPQDWVSSLPSPVAALPLLLSAASGASYFTPAPRGCRFECPLTGAVGWSWTAAPGTAEWYTFEAMPGSALTSKALSPDGAEGSAVEAMPGSALMPKASEPHAAEGCAAEATPGSSLMTAPMSSGGSEWWAMEAMPGSALISESLDPNAAKGCPVEARPGSALMPETVSPDTAEERAGEAMPGSAFGCAGGVMPGSAFGCAGEATPGSVFVSEPVRPDAGCAIRRAGSALTSAPLNPDTGKGCAVEAMPGSALMSGQLDPVCSRGARNGGQLPSSLLNPGNAGEGLLAPGWASGGSLACRAQDACLRRFRASNISSAGERRHTSVG